MIAPHATRRFVLVLGLGMAASGCGKEPSYRMRWDVIPRDGEPLEPLPEGPGGAGVQNPNECTRSGVVSVQVTAWDSFGLIADQRTYPCYPREFFRPEGTARGAVLDPGEYQLVVRGVRRNGVGWTGLGADLDRNGDGIDEFNLTPRCEDDEQCEAGFLSCDCRIIDVVEDETIILDDLVLAAPPQCEDGIDNDRDGLVDGVDPGCARGGSEFDDIISAQFRLRLSLLGDNPNVACSGVPATQFAFFAHSKDEDGSTTVADCDDGMDNDGDDLVDADDPGCTLGTAESDELGTTLCRLEPFFFTTEIATGEHELRVVGLGPSGSPVTRRRTHSFTITGFGDFVEAEIDFGDADFLEPIVAPSRIPLSFESVEGGTVRGCTTNNNDLEIATIRVNVLDARGEPLPTPILDESGVALDGTPRPCPTNNVQTERLTWGGYLIELEGLSPEGDVCFSAVEPLAPGDSPFRIPRPDGPIPPSCTECEANNPDRSCTLGECVDGRCIE